MGLNPPPHFLLPKHIFAVNITSTGRGGNESAFHSERICCHNHICQGLYSVGVLCCKQQKLWSPDTKSDLESGQYMVHDLCRALRVRLIKMVRDREQKTRSPHLDIQDRMALLTPLCWALEDTLAGVSVALWGFQCERSILKGLVTLPRSKSTASRNWLKGLVTVRACAGSSRRETLLSSFQKAV